MKSRSIKTKTGLIVGKFAPLHKGHQLLVKTALKKVDKLIILVYRGPKTLKISLKKRVNWLKMFYPKAKIIAGRRAPIEHGHNPRIAQKNLDYVKRVIHQPITHVFSSEKYGALLSKMFGAQNMVIDLERKRFPISGTTIRKNPKKYKNFLDQIIYREIKNIR